MSSVRLTIATDSAAFDEGGATEVGRILREAASKFELYSDGFRIHDINGNYVGELEVFGDNPPEGSIYGGGHYVPPRRSGRGHDPQALPLDEIELWVNNDEGLYAWWKSTRLSMRKFISENRDDLRGAIREVLNREPSRNPGRTLQVGTRVSEPNPRQIDRPRRKGGR
jgi:hypothetical protein